ncbi:MAG TPA: GIY-YIG nuclease family protein [bacterium]|nr:GIY-YIG nuclease family protein [bacterium]
MRTYYIYIISNFNLTVFYIGVSNNLHRRLIEHREHLNKKSFSAQYNLTKLLYYEDYENIDDAIQREKQLKNWHRDWKLNLIRTINPLFKDLSDSWEEFQLQ